MPVLAVFVFIGRSRTVLAAIFGHRVDAVMFARAGSASALVVAVLPRLPRAPMTVNCQQTINQYTNGMLLNKYMLENQDSVVILVRIIIHFGNEQTLCKYIFGKNYCAPDSP